jgi:hypothetical protein
MDVGAFVQENKRWLLGCAIGFCAFFIARSVVGSIYDPMPSRRAARGTAQSAVAGDTFGREALAALVAEQDALAQATAKLEQELAFVRDPAFSFEGKGLSPDEFLGKVGRERKLAILKGASERDVQCDPNRDLVWPPAQSGLDEIRSALFSIELVDAVCGRLFAAHDEVRQRDAQAQGLVAMRVGAETRRAVRRAPVRGQKPGQVDVREFVDQERVTFEFRSDEAVALTFLEALRQPGRTLTLESGLKITHTGRRADPVVVQGSVVGIAWKQKAKEAE